MKTTVETFNRLIAIVLPPTNIVDCGLVVMNATTTTEWVTANALECETGSAARHVLRWCADEGVPARKAGRTVRYQRDRALAVIALHQKPRRGETVGLAGLAQSMTSLRRLADSRAAMLEICIDGIRTLESEIIANSPKGTADLPEAPPKFTLEQGLWLVWNINAPVREIANILPPDIRAATLKD
jgi:hypothetical protein